MGKHRSTFNGRRALLAAAALAALVAVPAASAHVERASYWPDPAAETVGGVPTGGAVPETRALFKALNKKPVGDTRVVCAGEVPKRPKGLKKGDKKLRNKYAKQLRKHPSIKRLAQSIKAATGSKPRNPKKKAAGKKKKQAKGKGYVLRPSEPNVEVSRKFAWRLFKFNISLLKRCKFNEIQPAVNASGNNDRVVVMSGVYTEPTARSAPTNDPRCDQYEEVNDRPGDGEGGFQTGANTYTYVFNCPNDQNLIAVLGREPNHAALPPTPLDDRHGIPDNGACIRCNLQLEGSGLAPDDIVVDAGDTSAGNGGPGHPVKDVGVRADRADGFVLRNMTFRHVREHAIYTHEVDGYRLERFKTFHAEEYGTLNFTSDHGLMQDCEAAGSGDAGLYPGSAPDTGEQGVAEEGIAQRYNTEIRRCDMHHNTAGYSGTAANAVWLHHNDFYDNALGFTTDVFTAAGHPGFPQDSDLLENNEFYDNNFNPYLPECPTPQYNPNSCSDVAPTIPVPVGTGMWIAGGNNNEVRNNHFWDNWRRGAMLFTVPDAFVCGDSSPTNPGNQQHGCDESEVNTSYRNEFHGNVMGRTPGGVMDPNGTDFWWDRFPGTQPPPNGNCFYDNVGKDGTRGTLTADPPVGPVPDTSAPGFLPEDCSTSVGTTGASAEAELLGCLAQFDQGVQSGCTWFTTPPEPQP